MFESRKISGRKRSEETMNSIPKRHASWQPELSSNKNQCMFGMYKQHITPFTGNGYDSTASQVFSKTPLRSEHALVPKQSTAPSTFCQDNSEISISKAAKSRTSSVTNIHTRAYPSAHNFYQRNEDSIKALSLEHSKSRNTPILIVRFPDPEISYELVSNYSKSIESVAFPASVAPRYCFVQLNVGADVGKVIADISKIKFGNSYLKAQLYKSVQDCTEKDITPPEIDPCTLYLGNIPSFASKHFIEELFPSAQKIELGHAKCTKHSRHAFIRYQNVDEAIDAFKYAKDIKWKNRTLIIRFRRVRKDTDKRIKIKTVPAVLTAKKKWSSAQVYDNILATDDSKMDIRIIKSASKIIVVDDGGDKIMNIKCSSSGDNIDSNHRTVRRKRCCKLKKKRKRHNRIRELTKRISHLEQLITSIHDTHNCLSGSTVPYKAIRNKKIVEVPFVKSEEECFFGTVEEPSSSTGNITVTDKNPDTNTESSCLLKNSSSDENMLDSWIWRKVFRKTKRSNLAATVTTATLTTEPQIAPIINVSQVESDDEVLPKIHKRSSKSSQLQEQPQQQKLQNQLQQQQQQQQAKTQQLRKKRFNNDFIKNLYSSGSQYQYGELDAFAKLNSSDESSDAEHKT